MKPCAPGRAASVLASLVSLGTPEKARKAARFFKTGPGAYGEGDVFLGVTVPEQRRLARLHRDLPISEVEMLLCRPEHEARLTALFIWVSQFDRGDESTRRAIHERYLAHTGRVNNWDLVDSSAERLVGGWLQAVPPQKAARLLDKLATSSVLWERRIAMIATYADIKEGRPLPALRIAAQLLHDEHDLMHKAVGWMLREVGKRCGREHLEGFLQAHGQTMPRTALRYAIEHFSASERSAYLKPSRG